MALAHPSNLRKTSKAGEQILEALESQVVLQSKDFPLGQNTTPKNSSTTLECQIISLAGSQVCHSKHCEDTQPESPATPLLCHSERSEESLKESLVANRDSSPSARVQNDKLCYPQGKPTHNKHLQGNLLCHSERYGESLRKATRQSLSYCHSEGGRSPTEESLNESLVAHRDSSPLAGVQNDKITESLVIPKRDAWALQSLRHNKLYVLMGNRLCHTQGKLTPHNNPTHSNTRRSIC